MNEIGEKQNDSHFLMLQYAARCYYNYAEVINYSVWIICVINILLVSLPFSFLQNIKVITFLFSLATIGLQLLLKKNTAIAAAMRKYADYSLFEFATPALFNDYSKEDLVELSISIKNKNPQKAEEQYTSSGADLQRGVKDWYVDVDPNLNRSEAILYCQKQNMWWDRNLSHIYLNTLRALIFISIVILIIIFLNKTLFDAICFLASISALIVKLIWEYITIRAYRKISIEIDTLLKTPYTMNESLLLEIQNKIDQRRNMPFLSVDFLHKVTAKRYHKTIHDRNSLL